jgi:hypothetical protein
MAAMRKTGRSLRWGLKSQLRTEPPSASYFPNRFSRYHVILGSRQERDLFLEKIHQNLRDRESYND